MSHNRYMKAVNCPYDLRYVFYYFKLGRYFFHFFKSHLFNYDRHQLIFDSLATITREIIFRCKRNSK